MDDTTPREVATVAEFIPKEAAARLGLSEDTVRRLCATGELGGVNKGAGKRARWFVPATAITVFLANRSNRSSSRNSNSRNR